MYGAGFFRQPPYTMYMFQERFRNEGGKFFDADTMKATINSDIGVKVFTEMRDENKFMPPGVEQWGFVENLAAFLQGQTAMTISWPPYGRWAAGYGTDQEGSPGCRNRTIAGKVGYAMPPGGHPELAAGFALSVSSTSKNKEAAYLFIQWLNSEDISMQRVQLPYTLRDPFRDFALHQRRVSVALARCEGLSRGVEGGDRRRACSTCRCCRPTSMKRCCGRRFSRLWAGEDPKAILDQAAARMGRHHRADRRRQAEGRLRRLGRQVRRLSEVSSKRTASDRPGDDRGRSRDQVFEFLDGQRRHAHPRSDPAAVVPGRAPDRWFKYQLIAPAIFLLLLDRPVSADLFADRQLPAHHHDGGGHSFAGSPTTRSCSRTRGSGSRCCTRPIITIIALPIELICSAC